MSTLSTACRRRWRTSTPLDASSARYQARNKLSDHWAGMIPCAVAISQVERLASEKKNLQKEKSDMQRQVGVTTNCPLSSHTRECFSLAVAVVL